MSHDAFALLLAVGCREPARYSLLTHCAGLIWHLRCERTWSNSVAQRLGVPGKSPVRERRTWDRLPLAVPVFVRARDSRGKEFLEFATALNVSAGGILLAVSRSLPLSTAVSLEIPSPPLANIPRRPRAVRQLQARIVHHRSTNHHQLIGLKFSRPLLRSRGGKDSSSL